MSSSKLPLDAPSLTASWTLPKADPKPSAEPSPTAAPKPANEVVLDVSTPEPDQEGVSPDDVPDNEIVNNGTNIPIPLPFQPVSPMDVLASANPAVLSVMLRQLRDMKGVQPDTSSGALKTIVHLSDAFKHGKDVTQYADEVALHLTGRNERREITSDLSDVMDEERLTEMFQTRAKFEDFLHSCQRRSDVSIVEGIAMQGYFDSQMDKIFSKRSKRSAGEISGGRDPGEMLIRSNLPVQLHRKELQNKFNEATPQEREILRKLGFKIQQSMQATKITRTTTTETVELAPEAPKNV